MVNDIILINNKEIKTKEYKNQRVVTSYDIANLHERNIKRVNEQFKNNRDKLIENEDYFIVKRDKISKSIISTLEKLPPNMKELVLFTESGYLMLVKTFNDDLSWKIQRMLIKSYFRVKELQQNEFKVPKTFKEALLLAVEQQEEIERLELENKEKQEQLEIQAPKVSYYDIVLNSPNLVTVTQIAKDYGKSGKWLNKLLNELKIQYKQSNQWLLYSKYQGKGYTQSVTYADEDSEFTKLNTKWTQKGRMFIYDKLKELNILPVVEREGNSYDEQ